MSQNTLLHKPTTLVNNYKEVQSILRDINWNFYQPLSSFLGTIIPFDTRKHIVYPGTYVPEIPFTLIEVLSKPGAIVLDPFSGSGTTFFQSILLRRIPYGCDICKVSIEYSKSMFMLFDPENNLRSVADKIKRVVFKYDMHTDYSVDIAKQFKYLDKLRVWYSRNTFNMLCYLFKEINRIHDEKTKAALNIILLAITKNSCSQDRGLGCIADNMIPNANQLKDKDVFRSVIKKAGVLVNDIESRLSSLDEKFNALYKKLDIEKILYNGDIRGWGDVKNKSIDLIVTSPPYPNMTDYITSQRLNYYYLNSDPDIEKFRETGARFKRMRKSSSNTYLEDMMSINERLSKLLKTNGYLCLILPEFETHNKRDQNRKILIQKLIDQLEEFDLVKRDVFERILPSMRRSNNQKWATLKKEKIYIYQKV